MPAIQSIRNAAAAALSAAILFYAAAADATDAKPAGATAAALDAIAAGRWDVADSEAPRIDDPLARKIVGWYALTERRDGSTFDEIAAFMRANPDWPWMGKLRLRAEAAPVVSLSDAEVLAWFERHPPVSLEGRILKIETLRRLGRDAEARGLVRSTWISSRFPGRDDLTFLARFGGNLSPADHAARLDSLLWRRAHGDARDLLASGLVGEPDAAIARARLVLQGSKRAPSEAEVVAALDQVPVANRDHGGLRYDLTRWYRETDQDGKAVESLRHPAVGRDHPKRWWTERAILVRRMLSNGDAHGAYALARNHRQSGDGEFAEAEWLAGWIALRFVKKPALARDHFGRLSAVSSYPVSKARGAYWSGRAAQDLGDSEAARRFYAEATRYPTTFYGQFATARLGRSSFELPKAIGGQPGDAAAFEKRELVKAARLLARIGQDDLARPFIAALFRDSDSSGEWLLAGKLAAELRQPDLAVRGFKFSKRPLDIALAIGYPTIDVPGSLGAERALILGLIRQESEFYAKAVSPAGARGLMQLMPSTAERTAKSLKLRFVKRRLTEDARYNARLGSAHLAELIGEWQGSYVLALAAYNAGSGAVSRWIERNGDPRSASDDAMLDWIESIPYSETRNYVQRVLEAFQVYRARLGDKRLAAASIAESWQGPPANLASEGETVCAGDDETATPGAC